MMRSALIAALVLATTASASPVKSIEQVVEAYDLSGSYEFVFPSKALAWRDSDEYILGKWDVNSHGVQFGTNDISFVSDPASSVTKRAPGDEDSSSSSSSSSHTSKRRTSSTASAQAAAATGASGNSTGDIVLAVEYPAGSYSGGTGGTQFTAQPLNGTSSAYERMLLAYDIYFPSGFQFNQGGKLPGFRGGPDAVGCSGGHQADGKSCFSSRLMWRSGALGEVYAYLPPAYKDFCSQESITCNSDYGTSIGRSTFSFKTGTWQTIWMYVALNEVGWRNGQVVLWYNGVQAMNITGLEFRTTADIQSVGGMFFSTFFGGDTTSWASPATQSSYFRNIQMYGGTGASNFTGQRSDAVHTAPVSLRTTVLALVATFLAVAGASLA